MPGDRVDYDQVAGVYHRRYAVNRLAGVAAALQALGRQVGSGRILEVGCGTGRWLAELQPDCQVYGVDQSQGMLGLARQSHPLLRLAGGRAEDLPFASAAFDLIFCVNAIHHFSRPGRFVAEARRLLRPGGRLAIVGMNPHSGRDSWYLYHYFEGSYQADLDRFPSAGTLLDWLIRAGFVQAAWQTVEHIQAEQAGQAVLADYFLQKNSTSQLILLSDEDYRAGISRIEAALAGAEARGETLIFSTSLFLEMLTGRVPV